VYTYFKKDKRLGILIPHVETEWSQLDNNIQQDILLQWEQIRGSIPDRIKELEQIINQKQHALNHEENFSVCCRLNSEIADTASVINDLWLWYRANQELSAERSHT
jgi:hypothetical protein